MNKIRENRLWGGLLTEENLSLADDYPWFYANTDHVLVVSPEKPRGLVEMDEAFLPLLQTDDWEWLFSIQNELLREQEKQYREEFAAWQEGFLQRFEKELKARKEEAERGAGNGEE